LADLAHTAHLADVYKVYICTVCTFAVAGPKAWNQLPADIRAIDSVNSFKSALKTFLFRWLFV